MEHKKDEKKIYMITWYEEIYYWFWRRWDFIRNIPKELKWFFQRGYRGYADCDIWSLHEYLSEWMPKAIRQLKNDQTGCPSDLFDSKKKNNECWKWHEILEKIALGFEADNKIMNHEYITWTKDIKIKKYDKKKLKKLEKQMKDGLELFAEHYQGFWD